MSNFVTVLTVALGACALLGAIFLISESRRPQATLAWLLVLLTMPGLGLLIYFFFGRSRKAFSKETRLLTQDVSIRAQQLLGPAHAGLTTCNGVEILQHASEFYPQMVADMKEARQSIHLQYYIWRGDAGSASMTDVLIEKARKGVEVRLLYDPLGSQEGLSREYIGALRKAGMRIAPTSPAYQLHTISYRSADELWSSVNSHRPGGWKRSEVSGSGLISAEGNDDDRAIWAALPMKESTSLPWEKTRRSYRGGAFPGSRRQFFLTFVASVYSSARAS